MASQQPAPTAKPSAMARNWKILQVVLPKLPLATRVAIMHVLGLSTPSKYMDLRSELIVAILRSFTSPSTPKPLDVAKLQRQSFGDPIPKGRVWISTYTTVPPPETSARDVIMQAIDDLMPAGQKSVVTRTPEFVNVDGEWTGYRRNASTDSSAPKLSEKEKYNKMMKECSAKPTVLYLHGGGYYLMDPATHRPLTKKLAKITGGRCFSVRYRLSPGHAFPSALLDAFVSYLTLLYPPPDAYHDAVPPEHVVISGDSAGGNLTFALLRLLLELNRNNVRVQWHGQERDIPLPAGAAGNSPWLDLTHSLSSRESDVAQQFDYLPTPEGGDSWVKDHKPSALWPATPPRKNFYADDHLLGHPLVSPLIAHGWSSAPPIYICSGWEVLGAEDRFFAKKLREENATIVFEEYEAMPHCFAMVLPKIPGTKRCLEGWTSFITKTVEDPQSIGSGAVRIKAKTLKEENLLFEDLSSVKEDEIQALVEINAAKKIISKL